MSVYPTLTYRDVAGALAWVSEAFGLEPRVFADPAAARVQHAALVHEGAMVLVEEESQEDLHGAHAGMGWVYVAVDDVDGHYERAEAGGAEILNEPHDALGGTQRGYSARDLEGNLWTFGTARPAP